MVSSWIFSVGVSWIFFRLLEGFVAAGSLSRLVSFWIFFRLLEGLVTAGSLSRMVSFWIFFSCGGGNRMPILDLYLSFLDLFSRAEEGTGVSI